MMMRRTYALLVLDAAAWGRATFGLQLARELHLQGDRVGTTGNRSWRGGTASRA
jgi:hypothetical protein